MATDVEPGDARRLLEQRAPLGGLGGDDRADPPLADERRRMCAGRGVGEQQGDVAGADVAAVDAVRRAEPALDPADNLQRVVGVESGCLAGRARKHCRGGSPGVTQRQHHLGEVASRPRGGAGEDDVVHAAAAQRLGRPFAHHPAERLEQVRLAAAVGADDPGQAGVDPQFGGVDERFEPGEAETAESACFRRVGAGAVLLPRRRGPMSSNV